MTENIRLVKPKIFIFWTFTEKAYCLRYSVKDTIFELNAGDLKSSPYYLLHAEYVKFWEILYP